MSGLGAMYQINATVNLTELNSVIPELPSSSMCYVITHNAALSLS